MHSHSVQILSEAPERARDNRGTRGLRWLIGMTASVVALFSLGGCVEPPIAMHGIETIGYDGKNAIPPDCSQLVEHSVVFDAGFRRPSMAWGCATYTNLAAQIAQPSDLVAPHPLTPADGQVAADAIRRYQTGKVTPLNKESLKAGN